MTGTPSSGVILYGDSVFFGVGAAAPDQGCGALLVRGLPVRVDNRSRPGITARRAARLLERLVLRDLLTVVTLNFGNNDCRVDDAKLYTPVEEYGRHLSDMVRTIRAHGAVPVLCGLPPLPDDRFRRRFPELAAVEGRIGGFARWHESYDDRIRDVARAEGIEFIDIRQLLGTCRDDLVNDDGHPSSDGHRLIASAVADRLSCLLNLGEWSA